MALVATRMPKKPARMEQPAPATKHSAVARLIKTAIRTNRTRIKTARILYSDFKKALAPSAIALDISCIRLLPGAIFET